jgi:hypothetical protein
MKIKRRKKPDDTFTKPYPVPVSENMKTVLDNVKKNGIDVNGMTRDFWAHLIQQTVGESAHQE